MLFERPFWLKFFSRLWNSESLIGFSCCPARAPLSLTLILY